MPLTVEQFTQRLTSSGVMSEDELRDWIAAVPVEKRAGDGEQLARELVREKKLTKFQAEQIYAGKEKSLTLGNYLLLDKLGQGGMGMVLKARHKRMARVVALKVMSPAAVKSPDAVKRFHREVQTAAKLTHPNIVTAFDADEAKGTHFLVMEYVEGDDLSQLVKKHGPLSVEQTIECIIQAARGLTHAHAEGVIHRDIKPANLLLDKHGTVKILDMGLARLESGLSDAAGVAAAGLTQSGTIMGTVDYMSPEQAEDTRHADARADIYSLGCSLFYLLTGQAVYGGETMMMKLLAHRDAPIPSLVGQVFNLPGKQPMSGQVENLPHEQTLNALDAIFHKMIAKRTADRYQSMTEVITDLERCRAGESVTMNVNAVSGESGSNYELQKFLRQISGDEGSQVTSATSSNPFGGASVEGTAETVFTTNNSAGTDPQTAMTIAGGQHDVPASGFSAITTRWRVVLASVGVVLLLLGAWWMFRTPRGTVQIEIADEQIEVTLGETGRTLRGKRTETLKLPVGEHVLHVAIGEMTLDTPEVEVAKGKLVEIKVEKVGNRVRVMRGKEFLVAKELPRSKASGEKAASLSATNYALKFDGQSHVEIPSLNWNGTDPVTMEFVVSVDAAEAAVAGSSVIASWLSPKAETELLVYRVSNIWAIDWRHLAKRWISAVNTVRPNERALLTCIWDGEQTLISANADQGNAFEDVSIPIMGRSGLWIGGSDGHANVSMLFRGTIEQVRVSKGVRTALPGVPAGRLPKDKTTLALYHFDEGRGSVLKDSSGNNHHGKIVGANWVRIGASNVEPPREAAVSKITPHDRFPMLRNGSAITSSRYKPDAPASAFRACSQVIHLLALRACIKNREVIALPFLKGHEGPIKRVRFLPDGKQFVSLAWDGTARLWNVETGEQVRTFAGAGSDKTLNNLALPPDGKRLVVGGSSYRVYVFDVATGQQERVLQFKELPSMGAMAFSHDGRSLFIANARGVLHEFETANGTPLPTQKLFELRASEIQPPPQVIFDQRISVTEPLPDNERLLVAAHVEKEFVLWHRTKKEIVQRFAWTEPYQWVRSLALFADGQRVASVHDNNLVRIWSLETGKELKRWAAHPGKGIATTGIFPLHNDRWLLTIGDDKAIRLWDGSTFEKFDEATTEMLGTGQGAVSPDFRTLVTGAGWRLTTQSEYDQHHDLHVWRLPVPPLNAK